MGARLSEKPKAKDVALASGLTAGEYQFGTAIKAHAEKARDALRAAGYTGARIYKGPQGWVTSPRSYSEGWKDFGATGLPVLGALASAVASVFGGPAAGAAVAAATAAGTKAIKSSQKGTWQDPSLAAPGVPGALSKVLPAAVSPVLQALTPALSGFSQGPLDSVALSRLLGLLQSAGRV